MKVQVYGGSGAPFSLRPSFLMQRRNLARKLVLRSLLKFYDNGGAGEAIFNAEDDIADLAVKLAA